MGHPVRGLVSFKQITKRKSKSTEAVSEVFCKKTAFKNFGIFTGKQLCQTDSLFKKVAGLQPVTWWKAHALKNIYKQLLLHQSDYFYVPLSLSWTYLLIIDNIC